mmetsp:Transcript_38854/g.91452  ORF Transcript_38854/g.91452 Transcript_38854/m.91452 type:complete len:171 (-) Transcript_38854:222-734(-)
MSGSSLGALNLSPPSAKSPQLARALWSRPQTWTIRPRPLVPAGEGFTRARDPDADCKGSKKFTLDDRAEQPLARPGGTSSVDSTSESDADAPLHVRFSKTISVVEVVPYSEVYGVHPRSFIIDRSGLMVPRDDYVSSSSTDEEDSESAPAVRPSSVQQMAVCEPEPGSRS